MKEDDKYRETITHKISAGVSEFNSVYLWTNQASMPRVGMRVMISRNRQKAKNSPAIITLGVI